MNPWYETFLTIMAHDHDEKCANGISCENRTRHIYSSYALPRLREVIDEFPEAQEMTHLVGDFN